MFLCRLLLPALFASLVRGDASTSPVAPELHDEERTANKSISDDILTTRSIGLSTLDGPANENMTVTSGTPGGASIPELEGTTHQNSTGAANENVTVTSGSPIGEGIPELEGTTDQNSTGASASSSSVNVTSGNTELPPVETSNSPTAVPGPTEHKPRETTSAARSTPDNTLLKEDHKRLFFYDYKMLRIQGLVFALILFILGILILVCGKFRNASCCRKKSKKRKYDEVTRL